MLLFLEVGLWKDNLQRLWKVWLFIPFPFGAGNHKGRLPFAIQLHSVISKPKQLHPAPRAAFQLCSWGTWAAFYTMGKTWHSKWGHYRKSHLTFVCPSLFSAKGKYFVVRLQFVFYKPKRNSWWWHWDLKEEGRIREQSLRNRFKDLKEGSKK